MLPLVWISLAICFPALGNSDRPVIVTKYGVLRGKQTHVGGTMVNIYLGVPFAKPPVGNLRFAPPEPPEPWDGIRDAATYPPACLQPSWGHITHMYFTNQKLSTRLHFQEDCLYLNIYTPAHSQREGQLPVMVWFPGGAFVVGSASTYDGSVLSAHEDVVVVIIQNRLGILGFLSTGDTHARGNWALLDQLAALHWVQENIGAFGGDPSSVTLFGQSSGAICISGLILSPLSKGLFHRAISQSGTALMKIFISYEPLKIAKKIAKAANCATNSTQALVQCLRSKTEKELWKVSNKMKFLQLHHNKNPLEPCIPEELLLGDDEKPSNCKAGRCDESVVTFTATDHSHSSGHGCYLHSGSASDGTSDGTSGCPQSTKSPKIFPCRRFTYQDEGRKIKTIWFVPAVVDGLVFTDSPEALLAQGNFQQIPYLLGVNRIEFNWLLPFIMKVPLSPQITSRPKIIDLLWEFGLMLNITKDQIPLAIKEYAGNVTFQKGKLSQLILRRNHILDLAGDATFVVPAIQTARYHRDAGLPVYFYEFQHHASFGIIIKTRSDVADHGDEINFILGTPLTKWFATEKEKILSRNMMKYWANFARTGDPNSHDLMEWPPYGKEEKYLLLNLEQRVGIKLKEKEVAFWIRMQNQHHNQDQHGEEA